MTKIEKLLHEEKNKIDELQIPENLESSLRKSLDKSSKKIFHGFERRIAVLLIFFLFLGYNLDTLAYYGKKLVGYDQVMTGTLQELNEFGKGQKIEKSYIFSDGVSIILDGVMLDENNLILFYKMSDPTGDIEDAISRVSFEVRGKYGGHFSYGSTGKADEKGKSFEFVLQTDKAPRFYENKIKFKISYTTRVGNTENGEISFKLDRKQAVGTSISVPIHKKIAIGTRNINIKSLTASPTTTVVKGQIQNTIELGLDYIKKDRIYPENIELKLYADGDEVPLLSSGMSTNLKGINFNMTFDGLPESTKELQLYLTSLESTFDVNEEIELIQGKEQTIKVEGQDLNINRIYEENNNTYVVITTDESTTLPGITLLIDGQKKALQETMPGEYEKSGKLSDKVSYTRTLKFTGTGEVLRLQVHKIKYKKDYNQLVFKDSIK